MCVRPQQTLPAGLPWPQLPPRILCRGPPGIFGSTLGVTEAPGDLWGAANHCDQGWIRIDAAPNQPPGLERRAGHWLTSRGDLPEQKSPLLCHQAAVQGGERNAPGMKNEVGACSREPPVKTERETRRSCRLLMRALEKFNNGKH